MTEIKENNKIRVVWICSVSNQMLRQHLDLYRPLWYKILNLLRKRKTDEGFTDSAQWNTNAINEFEKIEDVDLHVIFTHPLMKMKVQRFKNDNISFYAVNEGDDSIFNTIRRYRGHKKNTYKKTWQHIKSLVCEIKPQIIHLMGAENPAYSLSILNIPNDIPVLVQLQTVLHEPVIIQYYPNLKEQKECERDVILRADYLGTKSPDFPLIIREHIKKEAIVLNASLLVGEQIVLNKQEKEFDFVYFANSISKAIDLTIEAFGIAHNKKPELTLDVIGEVPEVEKNYLSTRLMELGISNAVTIEGKLPTHDDVLNQIRRSRYALLPLKTDYISGTIREAICNGLPVVSTITQGTPLLNEKRESVLLTKIGDHEALANNMLRVIEDPYLAEDLRKNALITVEELFGSNTMLAREWVGIYKACINNYYNGDRIPTNMLNQN